MKKAIICFPYVDAKKIQYPTGLYKIATYCKDYYEVIVLDQRLDVSLENEIEKLLSNYNDIICIGISVMTGEQIKHAIDISKKFHKRTNIVWGGWHPTIFPAQTIKNDFIDYIIGGEGEEAFLDLLTHLDTGKSKGLFLDKENNNISFNFITHLNDYEYIDFNKYPILSEYFVERDGFKRAFPLETSRGCSHRCYFCYNSIFKKNYRFMTSGNIISIINYLQTNYHIDGIIFQEDNFFINIERVKEIIAYLGKLNKIGWKANSRINYFEKLVNDAEFMQSLINSNCRVLQFGIESGSQDIIKLINKNIDLSEVIHINKLLSEYPINIRYNFIVGFPTETQENINETFNLINRLMSDNPNVEPPFLNIYNPYPGTPLFNLACECGFNAPKTLDEWAEFNWNKVSFSWLSDDTVKLIEDKSKEFFNQSLYLK